MKKLVSCVILLCLFTIFLTSCNTHNDNSCIKTEQMTVVGKDIEHTIWGSTTVVWVACSHNSKKFPSRGIYHTKDLYDKVKMGDKIEVNFRNCGAVHEHSSTNYVQAMAWKFVY